MKLQNGFELEGNINLNQIFINDKWTQVLIIESALEVEKLRELFKENNIIIDTTETTETTYNTDGLIDIKSQDNKNYVWLYFKYSYTKNIGIEDIQKENIILKEQLSNLEDYILEKVQNEIN